MPAIKSQIVFDTQTRVSCLSKVLFQDQDQPVLLKQAAEFWQRPFIVNEAHILSLIDHPQVRKAIGFDGDKCQLVLEYIEAPTLKELTGAGLHQTNPDRVYHLLTSLAQTVADLHNGKQCQAPIIHNDLKPCNVLVQGNKAHLIDFTHAYIHQQKPAFLTKRDVNPIGTAAYMSPEKWDCNYSFGKESDVWAFGVLAYLTATGHYPFTGSNAQIEQAACEMEPISPLKFGTVSRNLTVLIMECLNKNPKRRPTMEHLANSLQQIACLYHR